MTRVSLDGVDEAVRRFVLSVAGNPGGAELELNGQLVATLVPPSPRTNGEETWTDERNARRCELIDRKYTGGISTAEMAELARLQDEMLRHRQRIAPIPLDDARRLHQELLTRATSGPAGQ